MFAAVAAGIYPCVEDAQQAMGQGFAAIWKPDASRQAIYRNLYRKYCETGAASEKW
jgi:L-ribulokinase